eukprot:2347870-Alexandrium_andersonii.AAC.1
MGFPEKKLVVLRTPFQEGRQTMNFRTRPKFLEQRTSWRCDVKPPGCWERAGVKRQPSPNTLEARRHPSKKFVVPHTSEALGSVLFDELPEAGCGKTTNFSSGKLVERQPSGVTPGLVQIPTYVFAHSRGEMNSGCFMVEAYRPANSDL